LAKIFRVPQIEVAVRLHVTTDWLRRLARDPQQAQRVLVAELEAILDQERAKARQTLGGGAGAAERCQAALAGTEDAAALPAAGAENRASDEV
jgi:hypothetical protein